MTTSIFTGRKVARYGKCILLEGTGAYEGKWGVQRPNKDVIVCPSREEAERLISQCRSH